VDIGLRSRLSEIHGPPKLMKRAEAVVKGFLDRVLCHFFYLLFFGNVHS
jgi:hypothetical protein